MFDEYIARWNLILDGRPTATRSSRVLPVRQDGEAAVLKMLKPGVDEHNAAAFLEYLDGNGAVRLLAADRGALLMERATGTRSLRTMATSGEDTEAAEILSETVERLHAPHRRPPPSELIPLRDWFSPLFEHETEVPILRRCAATARGLLASQEDVRPLHGDMHHDNVLDGGPRGWLAIDPKGLIGDRAYEFANLIGNPWPHGDIVHDPNRMRRVSMVYAARSGLDVRRIQAFAMAHAGLAASWDREDGRDATYRIRCAEVFAKVVGD
jgi:streptomycin 6-kinase